MISTIHDQALREALLETSKVIERAVRRDDPTLFFAAFVEMSAGQVAYLANGERAEIQRLLPELVRRIEVGLPLSAPLRPVAIPAEHVDVRLAVEKTCADVGNAIGTKLALFVFKNDADCPGGVGVNAYFCSLPDAPTAIRQWLARAKA